MDERDCRTLALSPLFAGADGAAARAADRGAAVSVAKGKEVPRAREGVPAVGIVLEGAVSVYAGDTLLNRIAPGGLYGVASLYGQGEGAPTRLVAQDPCRILLFTEDELEEITEDRMIRRNLFSFLSDRIRFLNRKVATFSAPSARRKLAMFLLERERDGVFRAGRSLTELASVLDLGRASLYRAMNDLEKQGAIRRRGREIEILSREALEKID
ncbi:MAG: Crp/Fnr family transcriptional regulator [Clostridia bacterium]|nr:Crp/Fnr family transcriptional regulator [Clostridia bacterium]